MSYLTNRVYKMSCYVLLHMPPVSVVISDRLQSYLQLSNVLSVRMTRYTDSPVDLNPDCLATTGQSVKSGQCSPSPAVLCQSVTLARAPGAGAASRALRLNYFSAIHDSSSSNFCNKSSS